MRLDEVVKPQDITDSSWIVELWHDGKDLFVEMINGAIYQYFGVPEKAAVLMTMSQSKGKFMWRYIRSGQFKYKRIH